MIFHRILENWSELLIGPKHGQGSSIESINFLDLLIEDILQESDCTRSATTLLDGKEIWKFSKRIRLVSIGIRSHESKFYQSVVALDYVVNELERIIRLGYKEEMIATGNWWEWTIGIPQSLIDAIVLLNTRIPKRLADRIVKAVKYNIPNPRLNRWSKTVGNRAMTNTNLLDQIQPLLLIACLEKDSNTIKKLVSLISNEATFVTHGEGLYRDGSFIFHVNKPYNGTYGAVYFGKMTRFKFALIGSSFGLNDSFTDYLRVFCFKGLLPFLIDGKFMASVCGRAAHRASRSSDSVQNIIDILLYLTMEKDNNLKVDENVSRILSFSEDDFLYEFNPEDNNSPVAMSSWYRYLKTEIESGEATRGGTIPATASKMTWASHMLRGLYASKFGWRLEVAAANNDIGYFEHSGSENKFGFHSGNGAYWLHPAGLESKPAFQGVEPLFVPGATIDDSISYTPGAPWSTVSPGNRRAGGIGDALEWGLVSMEMHGYQSSLRANKTWFMSSDSFVYMVSNVRGIQGIAKSIVFSTVEKSIFKLIRIDAHNIMVENWGLIESIGIPLQIGIEVIECDDEVLTINYIYVNHMLQEDVLSLIVYPCKVGEVRPKRTNLIKEIVNDTYENGGVQAVATMTSDVWAAFINKGTYKIGEYQLAVSRGCLIALNAHPDGIYVRVSDPEDFREDILISITSPRYNNGNRTSVVIPDLGRVEKGKFIP